MVRKKRFPVITLSMLAVLIAGTLLATSCGRPRFFGHTPEERAGFMAGKIADDLDLDAAQRVKLESMKKEIIAKMQAMHADREARKPRILALVRSDKLDAADVNAVIAEHEAKRGQMKPFIVEKVVEFHAILTPAHVKNWQKRSETFMDACTVD